MRPVVKVGLVVGGYVVALLVAVAVVALYVVLTDTPARQASGGMYAFGDASLFLAVFAVASIPPTGAVLFLLRRYRPLWPALSVVALGIAATGLAALVGYVATRTAEVGSTRYDWSIATVLRLLGAPLLALAFLLSGIFSPQRASRIALLIATGIEAAIFACFAFILFLISR